MNPASYAPKAAERLGDPRPPLAFGLQKSGNNVNVGRFSYGALKAPPARIRSLIMGRQSVVTRRPES
jgi:hypothetical protein